MAEFFQRNIVVVFFFYGLAFFSMGLAIWLMSSRFRTSEFRLAGALLFLAGFGIVHGLQEWFEMFELLEGARAANIPGWLLVPEVRLAHLIVSFLLLIFFGISLLYANRSDGRNGNRYAALGAGAFLTLWLISAAATLLVYQPDRLEMIGAADVLARYTLGITGAILAAWAIWLEQRNFQLRGMGRFGRALLGAAIVLLIYGVIGQVFTRPSFIFPSTVLNTQTFLDWFGFPVQLLRMAMAILMAVFIIRALQVFDIENQERLNRAQAAEAAAQQQALQIQAQARAETETLNEELQSVVQDLALLFTISRRLAGTLDRSLLLRDAVPMVVSLLPQVNAGMLVLRREPGAPPEIVSMVQCMDPSADVELRREQGLRLADHVLATGQPAWMIGDEITSLADPIVVDPQSIAHASTTAGGHTMAMPIAVQGEVAGSLVFCSLYDAAPFSQRDVVLARTIADQLGIALENATLYDEVQAHDKLRGELLHRVVSAQETERQRIARELHDGTGQTLTAIGLGLAVAADRLETQPEQVRQQLLDMRHLNAGALQELHDVIADLRPSILDNLGLVPALRGQIQAFESRSGVQTQLIVEGNKGVRLDSDIETTIFRIVQEALTNIARHAAARSVLIQLVFSPDSVVLSVQDDGQGFNVAGVLGPQPDGRSAWGLLGIQERASLVGGASEIMSAPDQGTTIRVTIPLQETKHV